MATITTCNYVKNYKSLYIEGIKISEAMEFSYSLDSEDHKDVHFDGVRHGNHKHPDITITLNRLITYKMTDERTIDTLLNCMLTDPKTITYIEQKSEPNGDGSITVSRKNISFKNCRLTKREETYNADENSKMNLEFTSEGVIHDDNQPMWSEVD